MPAEGKLLVPRPAGLLEQHLTEDREGNQRSIFSVRSELTEPTNRNGPDIPLLDQRAWVIGCGLKCRRLEPR